MMALSKAAGQQRPSAASAQLSRSIKSTIEASSAFIN
jgi:hypothetical protein